MINKYIMAAMAFILVNIFSINTTIARNYHDDFDKAANIITAGWTTLGVSGLVSNARLKHKALQEKNPQYVEKLLRRANLSRTAGRLGIAPLISIAVGGTLIEAAVDNKSTAVLLGIPGILTFGPAMLMIVAPADIYAKHKNK